MVDGQWRAGAALGSANEIRGYKSMEMGARIYFYDFVIDYYIGVGYSPARSLKWGNGSGFVRRR